MTDVRDAMLPDLPRVVLGTMTFADTADEGTSERLLRTALDAGVTWLDTANNYASDLGEACVGRLLGRLPADTRAGLTVATKVGQPDPELGSEALLSPGNIRRSVERSLRRLDVERLDLLYLHAPDRLTSIGETFAELATLVGEGKLASIGVSNFASWQIADAERAADEAGAPRPWISQQMYNAVARRLDEEYAEFADVHGLSTVVYNPLAGGMLTGRYRFEEQAATGRFATALGAAQYRDRYWSKQTFDAVAALSELADQAQLPLPELALRWLLSRDVVDGVLVGGTKPEHLQQNLDALDRGPLPQDLVDAVTRVGDELRGPMPAYNR